MRLDKDTVKLILDNRGRIEIQDERFCISDEPGLYDSCFWSDARCGYWKSYETGDIDSVIRNMANIMSPEEG